MGGPTKRPAGLNKHEDYICSHNVKAWIDHPFRKPETDLLEGEKTVY